MQSSSLNVPDLIMEAELESLNIHGTDEPMNLGCFQLMDPNEKLSITNIDSFIGRLGMHDVTSKIKVVSIFGKATLFTLLENLHTDVYTGNAGEGKSHTMNNLFFEGDEVFRTCSDQVAKLSLATMN